MFQRPVPRIIKYPKLIPIFGALDPKLANRNRRYFYFLRHGPEAIPLAETDLITKLKMPEYIIAGCASGRVLMSLSMQLKEVSFYFF